MDEMVTVGALQEQLLNLSKPLAALDLPLLDAHGATLASDLLVDEKPVIKSGQLIDSTQIALVASLGLDRLPCRPHPRVVPKWPLRESMHPPVHLAQVQIVCYKYWEFSPPCLSAKQAILVRFLNLLIKSFQMRFSTPSFGILPKFISGTDEMVFLLLKITKSLPSTR